MKLGIINDWSEDGFRYVKEKGLEAIEFCVNYYSDSKAFLEKAPQIAQLSKKYGIPVGSTGRWGATRLDEKGNIIEKALQEDKDIIEAASIIGCPIFNTGCIWTEGLSYYENCQRAIAYFEKLIAYGKEKNIKIATYNCRWNNFVCNAEAYKIIHGYLKDLYIKYDTSHCINAGGDYLQETRDWGKRFIHVHLKGAVKIEGKVYDNPPAGMDQTDWTSFMSILYGLGYDGGLSIEPESAYWHGELSDRGVDYTIRYFRNMMI